MISDNRNAITKAIDKSISIRINVHETKLDRTVVINHSGAYGQLRLSKTPAPDHHKTQT